MKFNTKLKAGNGLGVSMRPVRIDGSGQLLDEKKKLEKFKAEFEPFVAKLLKEVPSKVEQTIISSVLSQWIEGPVLARLRAAPPRV